MVESFLEVIMHFYRFFGKNKKHLQFWNESIIMRNSLKSYFSTYQFKQFVKTYQTIILIKHGTAITCFVKSPKVQVANIQASDFSFQSLIKSISKARKDESVPFIVSEGTTKYGRNRSWNGESMPGILRGISCARSIQIQRKSPINVDY